MSSLLLADVATFLQGNYVSVAILTAVGYDYVLTLSNEIEYIWTKPWTWVTTLFFLVRYCGLFSILYVTLMGSSFLPGPVKVFSEILTIVDLWAFGCFLGAADFVMILRVWAMYNQSRLILTTLLVFFSLEIISLFVVSAVLSIPKNDSVFVVQLLYFSFCQVDITLPIWREVAIYFQVVHGTVMCILAVVQSARQALRMYRSTKQWQLNRYMDFLVKQGIVYFVVFLLFNIIDVLAYTGNVPTTGWRMIVLLIVEYVPVFTLTPRFIISMREMYARNVQRTDDGIDSAFGLSGGAVGSVMVFADIEQNAAEEILMDETEAQDGTS